MHLYFMNIILCNKYKPMAQLLITTQYSIVWLYVHKLFPHLWIFCFHFFLSSIINSTSVNSFLQTTFPTSAIISSKVNIFCPLSGLVQVSLCSWSSCLVYCFMWPKNIGVKVTSATELCEFMNVGSRGRSHKRKEAIFYESCSSKRYYGERFMYMCKLCWAIGFCCGLSP